MISWHHAKITRIQDGIFVEDLGSRNGTFVNSIRISNRVPLRPSEEIGLGSFRFQLLENGNLAKRGFHGNVTVEAKEIAVHTSDGGRSLDILSLTVFPNELVALMGPLARGKAPC